MNTQSIEQFSREEAYKQLLIGNKVTHKYFTSNEYLVLSEGKIYDEDGFVYEDGFWSNDFLENGWTLF
jgi:hypothetical protein